MPLLLIIHAFVYTRRQRLFPSTSLTGGIKIGTIKAYDELHIEGPDEETDKIVLPAYLYRESFRPETKTDIAGKYSSDNSAGLIVNNFEKGRTIYCGVLAGIAYLKPAITESSQLLPTYFPDNVRRFLTLPAIWADVISPVRTSDPLVEAQYLSGAEGDIVALINWRDEPIKNLVVRFPGKKQLHRIKSLRKAGYFKGHLHEQKKGTLKIQYLNSVPEVKLDLGIYDYLLVDLQDDTSG
jgi:hypothetical protein